MSRIIAFTALIACILGAGCTTALIHPTKTETQFYQDKLYCMGLSSDPSTLIVLDNTGNATAGYALGQGLRQHLIIKTCMQAQGWRVQR